jgi:hypothetical protein
LIANSNCSAAQPEYRWAFIDHLSSPPEQIGVKAAPSERRNKVIAEVNRPTFCLPEDSDVEIESIHMFEEIRNQVQAKQQMLQFLKPEFVKSFSESCEIDTP